MVAKFKTIFNVFQQLYLVGYKSCYKRKRSIALLFPFNFLWIDPYSVYDRWIKSRYTSKTDFNWTNMTVKEILDEADNLYAQGDYLEVYEILNRIKFNDDPEVQWRICRALFRMSVNSSVNPEMREEMISEAYTLMNSAANLAKDNPYVNKWLAIITNAKCEFDGLIVKIKSFETMRTQLEKTLESLPDDVTTLYILGKLCYDMSRMSWAQRLIARILYVEPPHATYQDAYNYLIKAAESQNSNYYIPIYYVLGKTCLKMKQFFRARYYLNVVTTLEPRSEYEMVCVKRARYLLVKLREYDLDKDSILNNLQYTDTYG
ncbi:hypothetical protein MML48_8g00010868 [Holotrichia oblita]|uniref:Uncharacterized protein n=1 Tax=Holotrichia oblita TaxID=644536 RepID=A0ACB9SMP9_HOLOL|nr:hypothetical protein MML48_8g00010868 [Holotrichia oblita]